MLVVPRTVSGIVERIIYKCNDKKYVKGEVCLLEHLFENSNSDQYNEFLHDVSVTWTNKTDGKNPIKPEHYWQHTLIILAHHGF